MTKYIYKPAQNLSFLPTTCKPFSKDWIKVGFVCSGQIILVGTALPTSSSCCDQLSQGKEEYWILFANEVPKHQRSRCQKKINQPKTLIAVKLLIVSINHIRISSLRQESYMAFLINFVEFFAK